MKSDAELAKKNIELAFEFSRLVLARPELDDRIPEDAMVVFEVAEDAELTRYNRRLAKRNRERGQPLVIVNVSRLAPSRLVNPHVTLASRSSRD